MPCIPETVCRLGGYRQFNNNRTSWRVFPCRTTLPLSVSEKLLENIAINTGDHRARICNRQVQRLSHYREVTWFKPPLGRCCRENLKSSSLGFRCNKARNQRQRSLDTRETDFLDSDEFTDNEIARNHSHLNKYIQKQTYLRYFIFFEAVSN